MLPDPCNSLRSRDYVTGRERDDRAVVASVDGMAGPEAYAVLAPLGWWPPTQNPLLVREVVVEGGDDEWTPMSFRLISY